MQVLGTAALTRNSHACFSFTCSQPLRYSCRNGSRNKKNHVVSYRTHNKRTFYYWLLNISKYTVYRRSCATLHALGTRNSVNRSSTRMRSCRKPSHSDVESPLRFTSQLNPAHNHCSEGRSCWTLGQSVVDRTNHHCSDQRLQNCPIAWLWSMRVSRSMRH